MGDTRPINGSALSFRYNDTGRMSEVDSGGASSVEDPVRDRGQRMRKYQRHQADTVNTLHDEGGHDARATTNQRQQHPRDGVDG